MGEGYSTIMAAMNIDLALLALVAGFAAAGAFSGAIKQASKLVGLAAALLGAKPLAGQLAPLVLKQVSAPPFLVETGLSLAAFPILYFAVSLVTLFVLRRVFKDKELSKADRALGSVLGAAKAAAIGYVALSGVQMFYKGPLLKDSAAAGFAARHNFFKTFQVEQLNALQKLAEGKGQAGGGDAEMKALLESGDTAALLANPEVQKLLNDPAIAAQIKQMQTAPPPDVDP